MNYHRLWWPAVFVLVSGCRKESQVIPPEKPTQARAVPTAPTEPKADRECAAPLEPSDPVNVTIGNTSATASGYQLTFHDPNPKGQIAFGVLGPINEDSGNNLLVLKRYLKFFSDEKVDAIIVTGDTGEVPAGIARVLKLVADSKLPVLVIAGNRECRSDFTEGVNLAKKDHSNIVNMNAFRSVQFPEATLVSLPGYHDPDYINCATGCRYYKSTVNEVISVAKQSKGPVILVAHGSPRGDGSQGLDYASSGGNVGDREINRAIKEGNIGFGIFSNIKEAGARATDANGTTVVRQGQWSKNLYLNPGPADTVGWDMNDSTKSYGLASMLTVKNGLGNWKLYRAKALTPAERIQAKAISVSSSPAP